MSSARTGGKGLFGRGSGGKSSARTGGKGLFGRGSGGKSFPLVESAAAECELAEREGVISPALAIELLIKVQAIKDASRLSFIRLICSPENGPGGTLSVR